MGGGGGAQVQSFSQRQEGLLDSKPTARHGVGFRGTCIAEIRASLAGPGGGRGVDKAF